MWALNFYAGQLQAKKFKEQFKLKVGLKKASFLQRNSFLCMESEERKSQEESGNGKKSIFIVYKSITKESITLFVSVRRVVC